jgi:hypothetical protein
MQLFGTTTYLPDDILPSRLRLDGSRARVRPPLLDHRVVESPDAAATLRVRAGKEMAVVVRA